MAIAMAVRRGLAHHLRQAPRDLRHLGVRLCDCLDGIEVFPPSKTMVLAQGSKREEYPWA